MNDSADQGPRTSTNAPPSGLLPQGLDSVVVEIGIHNTSRVEDGTGETYEASISVLDESTDWENEGEILARAGHVVSGYAAKAKSKARVVCEAFVRGAGGGRVYQPPPGRLGRGGAVFFGVTEPTRHLWQQAKAAGRDWYYLDNSYFDISRGRMFRASRNAVQATGLELPDWGRWAALGLKVQPWRKHGRHVIIAAQSQTHMSVVAGQRSSWWRDAFTILQAHTDREIVVRGWRSNKMALASSLAESLQQLLGAGDLVKRGVD